MYSSFNKILMALVALMGLTSMAAFAANTVTPKGKKDVDIYPEASKSGKPVGKLKAGDEIDAGERKGMFWEVKAKGKTGYVSIMEVKRQAGSDKSSLAEAIRNAAQDSRGQDENSGVRARSAVMGVRGLNESKDIAGAGAVSPNLRMVYAMEDMSISQKDVEKLNELVFREIENRSDDADE